MAALLLAPVLSASDAQARERAVLAMTWQPAFCEGRPRLPECRTLDARRFDASHFALHGLWSGERRNYCGVSRRERERDRRGRWRSLEGLGLSRDMRRRLAEAMPGVRSYLHRHEWVKHGTCMDDTPNDYFRDALAVLDAVNASGVRDLFARSVGQRLETRDIRAAFDRAFGPGAGRRVRVKCRRDGRRQLIVELTVGLEGRVGRDPVGKLIRAARPVRPDCPGGIVDPVGLQ